jgi:O-methyltransferase involved in polyketide biosynthesis
MRPDGVLRDPDAVRIYRAIDYDYVRSFGSPDGSHALRSRLFDDVLRPWLAAHPGATVVELGCGLETMFQRCDDGRVRWLCVDVPEAIAVRERFLAPSERCRYLARSALDLSWMDAVDTGRGVLVTAQGLFMYFEPTEVERLVVAVVERFPGVELLFDSIPRWFSRMTLKGFWKSPHYRVPPMPWGVNRDRIEPLLERWSPRFTAITAVPYGSSRGSAGVVSRLLARTPGLRNLLPSVVHAETTSAHQG